MNTLMEKIEALPPALQREVEDFVDFVTKQYDLGKRHVALHDLGKRHVAFDIKQRDVGEKEPPREEMHLSWRGALRELRDEYTSVELQHKASEWRLDA